MYTPAMLEGQRILVLPNLPEELARLGFVEPHKMDVLIGTTQRVYSAFPATHEGIWPPEMEGQYTQWETEQGEGVFYAEVDLGVLIPSTCLRVLS